MTHNHLVICTTTTTTTTIILNNIAIITPTTTTTTTIITPTATVVIPVCWRGGGDGNDRLRGEFLWEQMTWSLCLPMRVFAPSYCRQYISRQNTKFLYSRCVLNKHTTEYFSIFYCISLSFFTYIFLPLSSLTSLFIILQRNSTCLFLFLFLVIASVYTIPSLSSCTFFSFCLSYSLPLSLHSHPHLYFS
ncbi:hypothetical protein E2C01_087911 [Portunus trituberculatus]|uniref:Uncharacterized protein n=1 Tax=Portunus trituberculatus TaxID=210409 RepID=A0A5B7JEL4_PORTR|nr:hypothetical protein [Portunus trituberculatus]